MQQQKRVLRSRRRRRKRNVNDPVLFFAFTAIGVLVVGVLMLISIFPGPAKDTIETTTTTTESTISKNINPINTSKTNTSVTSIINDVKQHQQQQIIKEHIEQKEQQQQITKQQKPKINSIEEKITINNEKRKEIHDGVEIVEIVKKEEKSIEKLGHENSVDVDTNVIANINVDIEADINSDTISDARTDADINADDDNKSENNFPIEYLGTSTLDTSSYEPEGGNRYSQWKDGITPYKITKNILSKSNKISHERKIHIKNAMIHAWNGYKTNAFGADEVRPVSGDKFEHWGGIGITLIDSLDTLWLMDMKDEFWEARDWVRDKLDHDKDVEASVFETTIRSLGGLLSAYSWSKDVVFLEKAKDLGERLFKSFQRDELEIPYEHINLKTGVGSISSWLGQRYVLADMGTLQIEFRELASVTGNEEYAQKVEHVFQLLKDIAPTDGLYPNFLSVVGRQLFFDKSDVSFGGFGDSFFEYELKIWLQGGKKEPMYREMYDASIDGMHSQLLNKSGSGLWYIGTREHRLKFEHLTCFMGGLLALGAYTDPDGLTSTRAQRDLKTAKQLAYTCYQMYAQMNTGLAPDEIQFSDRLRRSQSFSILNSDYNLRPETVETFFILNQLTGDPIYRTWGWEIFQSIEKYCKTPIAYGKYSNVRNTNGQPKDAMESYFLAETLKYLYLLNDPDTEIDILNKHVFNTEAHPFLILDGN